MALGSDTCRHILQTGLLNCGLEHTGTELRNVRTKGEERWGGGGWGVGGWDRGQAQQHSSGLVAALLLMSGRWDQTSDWALQHNFSTGTSAQKSRDFALDTQFSHTGGESRDFTKKKVYYLLKCFTLSMTMCLHNTYRRVKPLYIEK